ncbi:dentin sialophosphoprotein-like [Bicyclus anynana]|uniref:Dentin sialophosphoprotein-like n=1 Tax=Bicyclus anynana TaxID=110368 RepID=A0A6J1NHE9_BICAN|nr:dentin sialophosphoprotein-like [Bicyclus anynana]
MYTSTQIIILLLFALRTALAEIENFKGDHVYINDYEASQSMPAKIKRYIRQPIPIRNTNNSAKTSEENIEDTYPSYDVIEKSFNNILTSMGSKNELNTAPSNTYGMKLADDDINIWNNIAGRKLYIDHQKQGTSNLSDIAPENTESVTKDKQNTIENVEISKENIENTNDKVEIESDSEDATSPILLEEIPTLSSEDNKSEENDIENKQNDTIVTNEPLEKANDYDLIEKSFDNIVALMGSNDAKNDATSKTYGMKLSEDHGYIWNNLQKPGVYYNVGEMDANKTIDSMTTKENTSELSTTDKSAENINSTTSPEISDESGVSISTENSTDVAATEIMENNTESTEETTTEEETDVDDPVTEVNNTIEEIPSENVTQDSDELLNNSTEKATDPNASATTEITNNNDKTTETNISNPESEADGTKDDDVFKNIMPELLEILKKYIKKLVKEEVAKLNCAKIETDRNNSSVNTDSVPELPQEAY